LTNNDLTQRFQTTDGFNIAYRHWKASKPKRVVVCIHGIGDYSGWFRNIAPELAAEGSEVYALDLRGFGESQEEGLPRGFVGDFERHLQDIDDFVVHLRNRHKGKRLFVFGHSLGGVYSVWYAANFSNAIDGLVLAAPAVTSSISTPKNRIKICFENIFIPKKIHNPYASPDAANRDPEEIKIMIDDPLETWQLTVNYLSNVKKLLLKDVLRNASLIQTPTLILQGDADVTVQPTGAKQLYTKLAVADKKLEFFADAGHWFYDALSPALPRSKCDAAKREKFIATIQDWLRNH
jgi:alpha-beta hydrolase superfamily lysophospholipase